MIEFNKKLIFRKFFIDNTYFFLSAIITLGLIVWVIQAVNFLDYVTEDGHGLGVYFKYSILNFPKIISRLFPLIFFVSIFALLDLCLWVVSREIGTYVLIRSCKSTQVQQNMVSKTSLKHSKKTLA